MKEVKTGALSIIFLVIVFIFPAISAAGDIDPSGAPGPTMKTLDEIPPSWHQILPTSERFENVMGGEAVLDKETGLVWAKNANLNGLLAWQDAITYCYNIEIANRKGWRLPTIEELSSIVDTSIAGMPKVPSGVFNNVVSDAYWSSTALDTNNAWRVRMNNSNVFSTLKIYEAYVWPVRGGK